MPDLLPPDIKAILQKLRSYLESDVLQYDCLPEPYRSSIAHGVDCDELPNASGEFGRVPSNPIPTNGPIGEVLYLSRLRTRDGTPMMFHRIGTEDGAFNKVDVYEVLSLDGVVRELLFLSMYHPRKSRKTPDGYTLAANLDPSNLIFGVNHLVENFPEKLDAYIREWQKKVLGIPLPVRRVREAINGASFHISFLDEAEADNASSEKRSATFPIDQADVRDVLAKYVALISGPSKALIRDESELPYPKDVIKAVLRRYIQMLKPGDRKLELLRSAYIALANFQSLSRDERQALSALAGIGAMGNASDEALTAQATLLALTGEAQKAVMQRYKEELDSLKRELGYH